MLQVCFVLLIFGLAHAQEVTTPRPISKTGNIINNADQKNLPPQPQFSQLTYQNTQPAIANTAPLAPNLIQNPQTQFNPLIYQNTQPANQQQQPVIQPYSNQDLLNQANNFQLPINFFNNGFSGFDSLPGVNPQLVPTQNNQHPQLPQQQIKEIRVPQPYPVFIPKPVPVQIPVRVPVEVPKPYPVQIPHPVPVPVQIRVPVPFEKPYPVQITRTVPVPVEKPVYIRVPQIVAEHVPQPFPNFQVVPGVYQQQFGNVGVQGQLLQPQVQIGGKFQTTETQKGNGGTQAVGTTVPSLGGTILQAGKNIQGPFDNRIGVPQNVVQNENRPK